MQPGIAADPRSGGDPIRDVFERIRTGVDGKSYDHWIKDKIRLSIADDTLTVGVASPFILAWMQRQFSVVFRTVAREVLGASARVVFQVDARLGLPVSRAATGRKSRDGQSQSNDQSSTTTAKPALAESPPRSRGRRFATLADFVAGPESELALAAARQLCESPRTFQGPLYLFGEVGLGKTHLLEGVSQQLRRCPTMRQVAYFTAESFTNYYTEALRGRTLPAFRNRFRKLDALIVDDIDFLDGKRGIQQEFLHTVQHLEQRRRLVVLASDRHPRLLTRTMDELMSRFLAGTICRIGAPDFETRFRILEQRATRLKHRPTRAVLEYIANRFRGNVRELEGALNCLDVYAGISAGPLGVGTARRVLGDLERDCLRTLRVADIEQAVCETLGVDADDVRSAKRSRSVSQPRMVAMYLARKHTQATYGEIGAHFGGRNHSTVIAAVRKMNGLLHAPEDDRPAGQSSTFEEMIRSIEGQLRAS